MKAKIFVASVSNAISTVSSYSGYDGIILSIS